MKASFFYQFKNVVFFIKKLSNDKQNNKQSQITNCLNTQLP